MREPITTNLRKLEILAADAFKRLERKSYIHSGNYSQYKTGHTPIPPHSHDESGLRSHSFEDFVASLAYQKNVRKIMKKKEKPWTKSNSVLFKPKIIEIPEIEEVPITPIIQEN